MANTSGGFVFAGLDEFREMLQQLPEELTKDGGDIVKDYADEAYNVIRESYPHRSGNLRDGLVMQMHDSGRHGVSVRLVNAAPHAYLFEVGTEGTRYYGEQSRGKMPAGKVVIPNSIRIRRMMYLEIIAMMQDKGLIVSGGETL